MQRSMPASHRTASRLAADRVSSVWERIRSCPRRRARTHGSSNWERQFCRVGQAEERNRMDRIVVCEKNLIWFEVVPVVVGDELIAAGIFYV